MGRFKTVTDSGQAMHRMFIDGILKVNGVDKDKNYKVSLMLLNGLKNRNGWVYEGIRENLNQFVNIPILCAWVHGKPDGHNFEMKTDPETGEEYASFVGADSEKIIGWINAKTSSGEENVYMANVDGVEWASIREAFIPTFYNKEFIDALEREGGQMKVSIETLVKKSRMEGDTEYEMEWEVVGVTVISVTEAVAGANIRRKANAYGKELKEIKIRAAQYYAGSNKEPQTQTKNSQKGAGKAMRILNLDDLKGKFTGYSVLAVNGLSVALLSDNGRACAYTFREDEDTVVPERIREVAANSVFGEGDETVTVPAEQLVSAMKAKMNAAQTALESVTAENAELKAKVNEMEKAEEERRKNAVREAIKRQIELNKKDGNLCLDENFCSDLMTDEAICNYAKMENEKGFCGDEAARRDVDARCMKEIRAKNNEAAQLKRNSFSWQSMTDGIVEDFGEKGVYADAENIIKD